MLKSFAAFEYVKSEDQDIIERILVVLANIFTSESSSREFLSSRFKEYKGVLRQLRYFINENALQNEVRSPVFFSLSVWVSEQPLLLRGQPLSRGRL